MPSERVAEIIPEFGTNGKDKMTVEQVLLHVGGFPNAPYPQDEWLDKSKRLERFAKWRLEWPVGSKFEYHPTSGFWVIAEIIERRTGKDFRQFVHERISTPLGLPELRVGLPREFQNRASRSFATSARRCPMRSERNSACPRCRKPKSPKTRSSASTGPT